MAWFAVEGSWSSYLAVIFGGPDLLEMSTSGLLFLCRKKQEMNEKDELKVGEKWGCDVSGKER